ncbi:zinc transporter ZIP10 [Trichonephila clavipes]|nr:zinc transporter ZIP10 [Trichonephila clavipes]
MGTLNNHRAISSLVRLVEGPCPPLECSPSKLGYSELRIHCIHTSVHLALCHMEFHGPRSDIVRYGHDGQMTFEGFEHLLESLGLGNIIITDHDVKAHKENEFRSIHGTHDHSKKADATTTSKGVTSSGHSTHSHTHPHPTEGTITSPGSSSSSSRIRHTHHSHDNVLPTSHSDFEDSSIHRLHPHGNTTVEGSGNDSNAHPSSEGIFHYRFNEVKIPELLVNISILVDQHQELEQRSPGIVIEQCLSPREILEAFGINQTSSLNPVSFLHLCPAIIYELDQGHCMFRDRSHNKERSMASVDQWLYSIIAVIVISLCGLLSVAVIPIMQKWFYHTLIQFLIGLAIGSLTGDGLLHLMPHKQYKHVYELYELSGAAALMDHDLLVYGALAAEVQEQMFRSGGLSNSKLSLFSSQAR